MPLSGSFTEIWLDLYLWLAPVNNPKHGWRMLILWARVIYDFIFHQLCHSREHRRILFFFLKMLLCLHRHWTEEMVLYVCFHGDAQKIYCQDCLRYSRNLFVWFITLFWCVIGILVTMLFILYINLGSSISFPLFISYYAVKKNLNKILTLKSIDSSPIKGRMLKETKYLKVIWKKKYLKNECWCLKKKISHCGAEYVEEQSGKWVKFKTS